MKLNHLLLDMIATENRLRERELFSLFLFMLNS